jgi:putative ABC transport system permease protein
LVKKGSETMLSRAENTPLLVGAKGSQTELNLSALYFKEVKTDAITYAETYKIEQENLAIAIPLSMRFKAKSQPIIGTTTAYFDFRKLSLKEGRSMAVLGECVLGSEAAKILNTKVGSAVISSPAGAFDIAGSFPLKMPVVGVLNPTGTADDQAVFVDIKTSWVIAGFGHGHQDLKNEVDDNLVLSKTENEVVASPSVLSYSEITPENKSSFHFHGNLDNFPVDAIIAVPKNKQSSLMLRGRYENAEGGIQMIVPKQVMEELLSTIFSVRDILILGAIITLFATLIIITLVFVLSIQLRKGELQTMRRIGAAKGFVLQILGLEIILIITISIIIAISATFLLQQYQLFITEKLIQ